MKVMKPIGLLSVLILSMLAAQSACGIATLPYSTYGSQNKWAGYKDYTGDNFDVTVYFNVYEIDSGQFYWQGDPLSPEDEYIYAYQIINNGDESNNSIGGFSLLYADDSPIAQHLMHNTSSQYGGFNSIAPDPEGSTNQGEWVWSTLNGYVEAGQQSWLLMFSSEYAPTRGKFVFQEGLNENEPPAPIPEPASIILFGSAAGWILTRRNKKRR